MLLSNVPGKQMIVPIKNVRRRNSIWERDSGIENLFIKKYDKKYLITKYSLYSIEITIQNVEIANTKYSYE